MRLKPIRASGFSVGPNILLAVTAENFARNPARDGDGETGGGLGGTIELCSWTSWKDGN
jgi:hypothetical protein